MKKTLTISFLSLALKASAALDWNNGDVWTQDQSSYDTSAYRMSGVWMAGAIVCLKPSVTNLWVSVSRSGADWVNQRTNQQEAWCSPIWSWAANLGTSNRNLMLPNDNSEMSSNTLFVAGTNLMWAPKTFNDGVQDTNYGFTYQVLHIAMGGIPNNDVTAQGRQDASTNLNIRAGSPIIYLQNQLLANGFQNFQFYAQGHPVPGQHLEMALFQLIDLGVDTNIWSVTYDWNAVTATTNNCVVTELAVNSGVLTNNLKLIRQQFAWDVPDGTVTNDATTAFTNMPFLGNAFNCILKVSNVPVGTYDIRLNGTLVKTASNTELANGVNFFTNYSTIWWQRAVSVKNAILDLRGADHVTLLDTHNAGSNGTLGIPDLINYQSQAQGNYATKRGSTYVTAMTPFVGNLWQYMQVAYNAVQPTAYPLTISPSTNAAFVAAPFR